ncbi:MAG TPA: site-2 protease family protein, partial [Thermoleophilia bacterium]|nr:site-2 protease family protein [Thermoleophilia bacterium]
MTDDDREMPAPAPRKASSAAGATERSSRPPHGSEPSDDGRQSPWGLLLVLAIAAALVTGHWTLLVAILGLALLIFVHELGHFLAAKYFHMRVERFYIGFPPAVFKRRRGETEYGIGAIPLGGFCKISGMTPDEELPDEVVPRAYYSKPVWQRNITILAGPLMNVVAAVVILFVFFQAAGIPRATLTVDQIVKGTPAATSGLRAGDRLVSADGVALKSWDQATAFFASHPKKTVTFTYSTPRGD